MSSTLRYYISALFVLAVAAAPSALASEQPTAATVANSFRHILHSDAIGQDFIVDVALPYIPTTR